MQHRRVFAPPRAQLGEDTGRLADAADVFGHGDTAPHPAAGGLIADYLEAAGHDAEDAGALFRPLHHSRTEGSRKAVTPDTVYKLVWGCSAALGFEIGAHALRATLATHELDPQADIAKVQESLRLRHHCHDSDLRPQEDKWCTERL